MGVWTGFRLLDTGVGWALAFLAGSFAAGLTIAIGQALLALVPCVWARLLVAVALVVPPVIAGYHATLGIVRFTMSSETWQVVFAAIAAVAVGITDLRAGYRDGLWPVDRRRCRRLSMGGPAPDQINPWPSQMPVITMGSGREAGPDHRA